MLRTFFFLMLTFATLCLVSETMANQQDDVRVVHEVLSVFYTSTNGDQWCHNCGWNVDVVPSSMDDYNQWRGLSVVNGALSGISLNDDNLLSGTIPPELGRLTNLKELSLNNNQLSGTIPPELGNLTKLEGLWLGDNQLSGTIPPELGKLVNLEELRLGDNRLSGPIPPELGNLTRLTTLYLVYNQLLSGPIPPELGNLANLEQLWLGVNRLSGSIPPEMGNLMKLKTLDLFDNRLSGPLPLNILQLKELTRFVFSSNLSLCAPADSNFQAWLDTIETYRGPTCYSDEYLRNLSTTPIQEFEFDRKILSVAFSPDGTELATQSQESFQFFDVVSGGQVREFIDDLNPNAVPSVAFSPDGTFLASRGRVWHIDSGIEVADIVIRDEILGTSSRPDRVMFSPNSSLMAVSATVNPARTVGVVSIWDVNSWREVKRIERSSSVSTQTGFAFSPDGGLLAVGHQEQESTGFGENSHVRFYDVNSWDEISRTSPLVDDLSPNSWASVDVSAFSPDGALVLGFGRRSPNNTRAWIQAWDVSSGDKVLRIPKELVYEITSFGTTTFISPNGLVAIGDEHGDVGLWHLNSESRERAWEFRPYDHYNIRALAFSPDGTLLATAGLSPNCCVVHLWQVPTFALSLEKVADQNYTRGTPILPLVLPRTPPPSIPPVVYTLTPTLPSGLNFDPISRTIRGIPSVTTAHIEYTYMVTDATKKTASVKFKITVSDFVSTEEVEFTPSAFKVVGNYPNPFEKATNITFDLPWPARVGIEVLDVTGRRVFLQRPAELPAGWGREIVLKDVQLPSGVYLYRLMVDSPGGISVHTGSFVRVR